MNNSISIAKKKLLANLIKNIFNTVFSENGYIVSKEYNGNITTMEKKQNHLIYSVDFNSIFFEIKMTIEDSSPSKKQKNEYRDEDGDLIEEELVNKTIYLNVFSLTDFSDATIEKFMTTFAQL